MANEQAQGVAADVATPSSKTTRAGGSRKRADRAVRRHATATLSVLFGLALWEVTGRFLIKSTLFLATPIQALETLGGLIVSGELFYHSWVSAQEFLIGFIGACVVGIVIGLLMANFVRVANALNPWVSGIYATPIIAISPLFILWFGIGIWSKVAVVVSLVVFPVIINTEVGIRSTDRQLIEMVRAFGASQMQVFWKVSLPAATPFILAGVRLGVGRGLIGVVVGELFGSRAGLGYLIIQAAEVFDMPLLFAGIIVLAAAGILLTAGFQSLERYLVPWHYQ